MKKPLEKALKKQRKKNTLEKALEKSIKKRTLVQVTGVRQIVDSS